jgi:hypothetical protein
MKPNLGKVSKTPHVPNITAKKAPRIKEGPGENMPEMRGTKPAKAQYMMGSSAGTPKGAPGTNAAKSGAKAPERSPTALGHTHPATHAAFHALGVPKGGKY